MPNNPRRHGPRPAPNGPAGESPAPPSAAAVDLPSQASPASADKEPEGGTTEAGEQTTSPASPPPPAAQQQGQPKPQQPPRLNITDLKDMSIQKLTQIAKELSVAGATGMRKQ